MPVNLYSEMRELLKKHYNWLIVRHLTDTKCNCWRPEGGTPDPQCPRCQGMGWIFVEWIQKCKYFYETSYRPVAHEHDFDFGKTYNNVLTVYCFSDQKSRSIRAKDLVYTIRCKENGDIVYPIQRILKWESTDWFDLQLDGNKSEFIKFYAKPLTV
jgi:hypothetical protein